ncbi:MAG TPA: amidohydrolase family protein [Casimicrobiaceae bacterium]|nr:amidohydrolase family protein [Casimicrobiaceae bacterium]
MQSYVLFGGRFLDPRQRDLRDGVEVLIEGDRIREVAERPIASSSAARVDLRGRTLMPGLIDAHMHLFLAEVNLRFLEDMSLTLLTTKAALAARQMLMRGFTSARDAGGSDHGIKTAIESGIVDGPRLFIAGIPISQTGGHGDHRRRTQTAMECSCCSGLASMSRIADGVPEMLRTVRDELRKGADQIKLMVSGGVASQSDPLESLQFRVDEIEAAVEQATNWRSYVMAHAYSAPAILRAVECGVRTIEHGNLVDEAGARAMAQRGAYMVPTLVAYDALQRRGPDYGLTAYSIEKNKIVLEAGLRSLELCRAAGVKMGFGTDLLGELQDDQCLEFRIRSQAMTPQEIIHSATVVNAEIVQRAGLLGELVPGAYADLLVVDGDPYRDLGVFDAEGTRLAGIMKGGRWYKNLM